MTEQPRISGGTSQPRPEGQFVGRWRERYGDQKVTVRTATRIDDEPGGLPSQITVTLEQRWGPQLGDTRNKDLRVSREGAELLRDALTAALEWKP